jgi:hypothetical protein
MIKMTVKLKFKDRKFLTDLTKTGNRNSREFEAAYILLVLDKGKRRDQIQGFYNVCRIQSSGLNEITWMKGLLGQFKMNHVPVNQSNMMKK